MGKVSRFNESGKKGRMKCMFEHAIRSHWVQKRVRIESLCPSVAEWPLNKESTIRAAQVLLNSSSFFAVSRLVFTANAIVAIYSLLEMCASIREILHGTTILPEPMQLLFDFAYDQLLAYLALAAGAAGATAARGLSGCFAEKPIASFCVQAYISVALGLALSTLVSRGAQRHRRPPCPVPALHRCRPQPRRYRLRRPWYQGIGIRIEDEVLITETGHDVTNNDGWC
ncbi:hypothetical protein Cni_G06785 [Canna indica]|uniref:CASP-like protein n=1 Tax=Canna indica TaxID=4628 RepID=A0AAQ3K2H4_9LILI|nr:hypothetical protein Cni_G06785 [Canna indica]